MPEVRTDSITGRRVIIAPERAGRPFDHVPNSGTQSCEPCPFCAGNEAATPNAVLTLSHEDHPGQWRVRIVPNRYPAVGPAGSASGAGTNTGPCLSQSVPGRHEVVIESPDHQSRMHRLSARQFALVVRAWRDRMQAIRVEADIAHATLFKNEGAAAGASLEHVHSQLLTTPFVPPTIEEQLAAGARHLSTNRRNAWLENSDRELTAASRVVASGEDFVTFCPFASRFPGEMWIVPRRAGSDFDGATDAQIESLGAALKNALERLEGVFPGAACNVVVHTAPFTDDCRIAAMQWHLQITPRLTGIAGFEIGAGMWVNIVAPEDAAARLRDAT